MGKGKLFDLALCGYSNRTGKSEEVRGGEPLLMPETPGAGDQEHGGEVVNGEFTARPDEFAAHIEQVRSAWPDGPPMQCQDMPDWSAFCVGWWRDCFQCPYYDANPASSPCALWEAAFPGAVRWYPAKW